MPVSLSWRTRALAAGLACVGVAGSASAGPCDLSGIGARFSEATKLCGSPSAAPAAAAPLVPVVAAVVDVPPSVSIAVPGYRRRVVAALNQLNRVQVQQGTPVPTGPLIAAIAQRYRIDPHLLASIVNAESAGRLGAVSNKGALGLMQVMPDTARGLGVADPSRLLRDPVLAMSAGAAYLKQLQRQFGNNVPLVLAAYNAGPGAVVKYRGIPRYAETQGYVGTIMGRYVATRAAAGR